MPNQPTLTLDDLYRINTLEDPRFSPDGRWIAVVRVTIDKAENSYKRNIWLVPAAGGAPYQLTRSGKDTAPRWSPDGSMLAFVSSRAGDKPQIYLLTLTAPGGDPRALTTMPNGATNPEWSPDGTQIAFLAPLSATERSAMPDSPPADKLEGKQRSERREEDEMKKSDPRVIERVPYRTGTAYLTDRYAHVHIIAAAEDAKPRRLTELDSNHLPPRWSADARWLYSGRTFPHDADEPWRSTRLVRIRVEDAHEERLTDDTHAEFDVFPSPDGRWTAYSRVPLDEEMSLHHTRLALTGAAETCDVSLALDVQPAFVRWCGSSLYFTAETRGYSALYRLDLATIDPGAAHNDQLLPQQLYADTVRALDFDVHNGGAVTMVGTTATRPAELYLLRDGSLSRLTDFNNWVETVHIQPTQTLVYTNSAGQEIQGWYLLPVDHDRAEPAPLIVNIHGGPHIMWGPADTVTWFEFQLQAASGYAVFYCNPRGSGGYGEAFQRAIRRQWGPAASDDINAGIDALLAHGGIDVARVGVTGGSYGGYMTAWMIAHSSRFGAAVAQRGVYNLLSFFATSDIPSFVKNEIGATPLEDPQLLWEQSPLAHAHKIRTPLLILHSENDFRVPISEGEQLFGYLRRSGVPAQFVRYPREGHELTRSGEPEHRTDTLRRLIGWFDRFLKPSPPAEAGV